jgi:hypothetical protein
LGENSEKSLSMLPKDSFYSKILLFLVFVFSVQLSLAQVLKGKVVDEKSREPLVGATIILKNKTKTYSTSSGFDGSYFLKDILPGNYTLSAQYIGYQILSQSLEIGGTQNIQLINFSLPGIERNLKEITISSRRDRENDQFARRSERLSENVMNLVSARAIELSPDITVGNVLQRVSGVSVERTNSGDGQYAIIRGMDKRYSYTSVNGVNLPSPDDKNRAIPLDMFPAEMIERLEVVKALTPKMEGDAIAGAMNLVMKDAPDHLTVNANLSGGLSSFFVNHPFSGFSHSGINFKSPLDIYGNVLAQANQFQTSQLVFHNVKAPINAIAGLSIGNRILNDKLSFLLGASYSRQYRGGSTLFYEPNGQPGPDPAPNTPIFVYVHNRDYYDLQDRTGIHGKLDFTASSDHRISLYGLFLQLDDNLHRHDIVTGLGGVGEIDNDDRVQFTRKNLINATLSGHDKLIKHLSADWSLAYSVATSRLPDWVDLAVYRPSGTTTNYLSSLPHIWTHSQDKDKDAYLNFNYNPRKDLEIILGGMYRHKDRSNTYNDWTLGVLLPGQTRQVFTTIQNAKFSFNSVNEQAADTTNALNYTASEDISAGFIQGKYTLGKLQILAGVRTEFTHQNYASQLPPTEPGKYATFTYTDILPSIHLKYSLSPKQNLRLSYFAGISRPNLFELIPGTYGGDFYTESGNYNLKHTTSDNLDFRFEDFFNATDHLFLGAFYKNIINPIEYAFVNISSSNYYYEPSNPSGAATNYGLEVVGEKFIRNWGISGNYSYTHSAVTTSKAVYGRDANDQIATTFQNETRPLQGQSAHIGNLSLLYKNTQKGFEAQLSLVYTGKRLSVISPFLGLDFYQRATTQLDLSFEKRWGSHFTLFAKATNLLDNPIYQDVLHSNNLLGLQGQILSDKILVQKNIFNQTYQLGLRYKL